MRSKTALDHWKSGKTPQSLSSSATPMTVQDFDWEAGAKLVDYQIHGRRRARRRQPAHPGQARTSTGGKGKSKKRREDRELPGRHQPLGHGLPGYAQTLSHERAGRPAGVDRPHLPIISTCVDRSLHLMRIRILSTILACSVISLSLPRSAGRGRRRPRMPRAGRPRPPAARPRTCRQGTPGGVARPPRVARHVHGHPPGRADGAELRLVPDGRDPDPVRLGRDPQAVRPRRRRHGSAARSFPAPTPTSPGSTATTTGP